MSTLDEVRGWNAFVLARMADCAGPDSLESAGARMLASVRDDLAERVAWEIDENNAELAEAVEALRDNLHEIADAAPDVYTSTRWAEFVDLAAWQEDISELTGGETPDLTDAAGIALYIIAERLCGAILDDLEDQS